MSDTAPGTQKKQTALTKSIIIILAAAALLAGASCITRTPESDKDALKAIYESLGKPRELRDYRWMGSTAISLWTGITTDDRKTVTEINIPGIRGAGEIPPELGDMTNLKKLNMSGVGIYGRIPGELGRLTALEQLDLSGNELSGEIPPELGELASLKELNLRNNRLTGTAPPSLGNLKEAAIDLRGNFLEGCIPFDNPNLQSDLPKCP